MIKKEVKNIKFLEEEKEKAINFIKNLFIKANLFFY